MAKQDGRVLVSTYNWADHLQPYFRQRAFRGIKKTTTFDLIPGSLARCMRRPLVMSRKRNTIFQLTPPGGHQPLTSPKSSNQWGYQSSDSATCIKTFESFVLCAQTLVTASDSPQEREVPEPDHNGVARKQLHASLNPTPAKKPGYALNAKTQQNQRTCPQLN